MKQIALSIILLACTEPMVGRIHAQATLEQGVAELSKQISDGLTENQKRTIAVVEFGDLEGHVTNFGRFVAEELITRLYQTKKFKVIERQLLNKIVAEQKLSLGGMIDQTSAQKLGKLLGVDAIASGTVTDLGKSVRVNARLISTGTGEVFAVAATEIVKDDSVMALMGAGNTVPNSTSGGGTRYQGANIATKDIGSLRVVLKSVMPMKLKDQWGRNDSVNGIRCSFELINLETQRPMVVAMNASPSMLALGDRLPTTRTTLLDERGSLWGLYISDVTGISIVSVGNTLAPGVTGRTNYSQSANPAEIASLLQQQDEMGTNMSFEPGRPDLRYAFVFGLTTPIPPGQRITVVLNFVQDAGQATPGAPPKVFQIASEIVVGIVTTDTKKSYTLYNLTFDQVSVRTGGS